MTTTIKKVESKVNVKEFQDIIKKLKKAFPAKSGTMPETLRSILIESGDNETYLTVLDIDSQSRITVKIDSASEPGLRTIITEQNLKAIEKIKNEDTVIIAKDCVYTDKKVIELDINLLEKYPKIRELNTNTLLFESIESEFKELISIKKYCSKDEKKSAFNGILLRDNRMIATDTFRMALRDFEFNTEEGNNSNIPKTVMYNLDQFLDKKGESEVKAYIKEDKIKIVKDNITIVAKLINETFPNLEQVVPKHFTTEVMIKDKKELKEELNYMKEFAKTQNNIVKLETDQENNKIIIESKQENGKSAKTKVDAIINEDEIQVYCNVQFLIDSLELDTLGNITIKFAGQYSPIMINDQDLILPVRKV